MEVLVLFSIFFVVTGISIYLKRIVLPKIKGAIGEYEVAKKLKRLDKKEYTVLNDILLKINDSTTQIDHIVISRSGIFVIETKNYKGWIHGHERSEYWTQTIYEYKQKLRNPIKQNWVHVLAIKELLSDYNNIKFFPIIVFSTNGELKNIISSIPIIYPDQLLKTIKRSNDSENLSLYQMKLISDRILHHNIIDKKGRKNHIKKIKEHIRNRRMKEHLKICPKCGNDLLLRKGKYGEFYGCKNFPECRFTLNRNN